MDTRLFHPFWMSFVLHYLMKLRWQNAIHPVVQFLLQTDARWHLVGVNTNTNSRLILFSTRQMVPLETLWFREKLL
jgi:hypothetical protein